MSELRRRRLIRKSEMSEMGFEPTVAPVAGEWLADPEHWADLRRRLSDEVAAYAREHPLDEGAPIEAIRHRLGLPDRALVEALRKEPPPRGEPSTASDAEGAVRREQLTVRNGRLVSGEPGVPPELKLKIDAAFAGLEAFAAPEADRLAELGLGSRQQAAAVRAGLLDQLAPNVVLRAGAVTAAAASLAAVPQPFTLSEARRALGTSRRVAVPLLELLDRRGFTRRQSDDRRVTVPR